MIRVYIKDEKITMSVNWPFIETQASPEWATYIDSDFDISDHLVYESGELLLYKHSQEMIDEKAELESKEKRLDYEEKKLEYILSLV